MPGDDTLFYGVFATSTTGLMGSAICAFRLEDIDHAFAGRFKEQASSTSAWLPVLSTKVPEPRPGQCVNDTETLPGNNNVPLEIFNIYYLKYVNVGRVSSTGSDDESACVINSTTHTFIRQHDSGVTDPCHGGSSATSISV